MSKLKYIKSVASNVDGVDRRIILSLVIGVLLGVVAHFVASWIAAA